MAGGGGGGAAFLGGTRVPTFGIGGRLGGGLRRCRAGSSLPPIFLILLLRKSPPAWPRRISNLRSSTIVVMAQRMTSRMKRERLRPMAQERYQFCSSSRPNFTL